MGEGTAQGGAVGERSALRELVVVAFPAVVTMTSYTAMQFTDALVVSRLGPEAVAAQGNGGISAFVPASIMFGIVSMVNTFASQNLGAGRPERGAAYLWNSLWLTVAVWAVLLMPYAAALPWVFSAMRGVMHLEVDPAVAPMEVVYGRIMLTGMVFTIAARGLSHYFFGLHRPRVVLVSALVANALNVFLSIALVHGMWGFPRMGIAGSALGTVIGGFVEFLIPMGLFLSAKYAKAYGTRTSWRIDWAKMREIVRVGWPAGAMWGNEIVCWWVFMAGLNAHFGMEHDAAGWMVLRYMHLSFMPAVGLSIAMTAVVGKLIGAGRRDLVHSRTWLGVKVAMVYMGLCAVAMVVFRGSMMSVFVHVSPDDVPLVAAMSGMGTGLQRLANEMCLVSAMEHMRLEVISIGSTLLILAAGFQVFDAIAITISGALRGAADTLWPGVVMIVLSWVCIVGLGWGLVVWAPHLESLGPWIGAATYIVALAIAYFWRFESGAWKRITVVDQPLMPPGGDSGQGIVPELPGVDLPETSPAASDAGAV